MLENEYKHLTGKLNETTAWSGQGTSQHMDSKGTGYTNNAEFQQIAIPMIRRTFPELIAHDIVGVQPMTQPVGLAFALRFVADQSYTGSNLYTTSMTEVGHNNLDSTYSGSYELSAGEALGSKDGSGVGNEIGLGIGDG